MQWPDNEVYCLQFMRLLGNAQEGASTVSECFLTAGRIRPGDDESWYREWESIAARNKEAGDKARALGNVCTARSSWLRASNYFRSAEIFLNFDDRRREPILAQMQACSQLYLDHLDPAGEVVRIPCDDDSSIEGYFLPGPGRAVGRPVVVCLGGPYHLKDEHLYRLPRHARERDVSLLLVDTNCNSGPWRSPSAQCDPENIVVACMDYLERRNDVDPSKIVLLGDGLGGALASRAAAADNRFAALVCDGGIWEAREKTFSINWYSGRSKIRKAHEADLEMMCHKEIAARFRCPVLMTFGEHDNVASREVMELANSLRRFGVAVTAKIFYAADTAASPGHMDNPTIANEFVFDWIAAQLGLGEAQCKS
jgi:pimeloyl-ACP methyl ester carboxylesterase